MFGFGKKPKKIKHLSPASEAKTCNTYHRWYGIKLMHVALMDKDINQMDKKELQAYIKDLPTSQVCLNCGLLGGKDLVLSQELLSQVRESFIKEYIDKTRTQMTMKYLKELTEATIEINKEKYPHITDQQMRELLQKSFAINIRVEKLVMEEMENVHVKALLESFRVDEGLMEESNENN